MPIRRGACRGLATSLALLLAMTMRADTVRAQQTPPRGEPAVPDLPALPRGTSPSTRPPQSTGAEPSGRSASPSSPSAGPAGGPGPAGAPSSAGTGRLDQPNAAGVAPTLQQKSPANQADLLMRSLGLENSPIKFYGWIENSFTGNANGRPRSDSNFSVFPNRLADQWQGNQYYFVAENPLESNADYVNLGFRVDTLLGNDWEYTKSYGLFDRAFRPHSFAGVDLPQLYGSVHLPILTRWGMDVIGGRFYSPAGFESVMTVKRPLLSAPYLFSFTPFTLFGALSTLHLNERVNLLNGVVNGWDRWIDSRYKYNYVGGVVYTSRDGKTSLSSIVIAGPDQLPSFAPANSPFLPTGVVTNTTLQGRRNPYYGGSFRTYMSNVVTHNWGDKLTEAAEVFFVHENNVPGLGPGGPTHLNKESAWYGGAHWFLYKFNEKVTGVYRAEIFRDQDGAATGNADTYYEMTLGMIVKPKPWLWIRPEARYDWTQSTHPFSDGTRASQLTLAFDVILQF